MLHQIALSVLGLYIIYLVGGKLYDISRPYSMCQLINKSYNMKCVNFISSYYGDTNILAHCTYGNLNVNYLTDIYVNINL